LPRLSDNLEGYSKAIYSTWFYYGPDRVLFDAGEGMASRLENRAFAIRRVCLSHGHLDHISGLPTLLNIRMAGMGEKTKPLDIFYPEGDRFVEGLRAHLDRAMGRLSYDLNWRPVGANDRIPLTADEDDAPRQHERWMETFPTAHSRGRLTLGYRIVEQRNRLRPEFSGRHQSEIRDMVKELGRDAVTERYAHRLLAYLGDTVPFDPEPYAGADVLLHEATFLDPADRENMVHSTLDEAIDAAVRSNARELVLFHVSSRYPRRQIRQMVPAALSAHGFPLDRAWLVYERHMDRADELR
jgi:ribonuclease Z